MKTVRHNPTVTQELVHMVLKDNDDQIIGLFQKVYAQEENPSFKRGYAPY